MKFRFDEIAINSTEKKKPVEEDKKHYLGLEHLDPGQLKISRYGSEVAPIGEKLIMKKGDVLFGKRRAYQKKVAIAPFDGIFSAHGMVLRPNEEVISKELFPFFISSDYFLDDAIRISVGSLSPTINWRDLRKLEFSLPDKAEQDKLAELLWGIEENIETYNKLILATEELIKAKFIEMFGQINKNPNNWDIQAWKCILEIRNGKSHKKVADEHGEYPVYGSGGVMGYATDYLCPENTIIIGRKGTINKPILVKEKFWNVDTAFGLIPDVNVLNHNYLFWFCNLYDFERHNKAAVLPSLTKNDLLEIEMKVPPLNMQKEFAVFVENANKTIDSTIETLKASKLMKKAIIKKYLG